MSGLRGSASGASDGKIAAVGAENEYANVIEQIGGKYVDVSAVTATRTPTRRASRRAQRRPAGRPRRRRRPERARLRQLHGKDRVGSASDSRQVIDVQELLGLPDSTPNPHLWYKPETMPAVARQLVADFAETAAGTQGLLRGEPEEVRSLAAALADGLEEFSDQVPGAAVATTEPVADYMLEAAGIENLTPFTMQADIMNDADPAPQAVALQEGFFSEGKADAFVYNQQVTDSITEKFLGTAAKTRRAGGRRLRDDADRLHLPALDGGRAGGARRSRRAREVDRRTLMGARAMSEAVLSVEGLGVRIAGRQVLDGVDFRVAPGEFTGLIGSNGAGKTTLFRAILGLQAAGEGRILVDGRPRTRRTDSLGYVPQKFLLDPDLPLRGRDLVGLGLDARKLGFTLNRRRKRELVEEMLAAVGAEPFADTRVGRLSGGEQQRILIAHALISGPRLLLADEPLANLDLRSSGRSSRCSPGSAASSASPSSSPPTRSTRCCR